MSMIYDTLQNVQSLAGEPLFRQVVPPVLLIRKDEDAKPTGLIIGSLAGILAGVLLGLLMIG